VRERQIGCTARAGEKGDVLKTSLLLRSDFASLFRGPAHLFFCTSAIALRPAALSLRFGFAWADAPVTATAMSVNPSARSISPAVNTVTAPGKSIRSGAVAIRT